MFNEAKVFKAIEEKEPQMIAFLERLVNIESAIDSPEGIHEVATIVRDKLASLGFDEAKLIETPNAPTHVFGHKAAKDPNAKKIMIMGHMDTVFPKGTVAQRPFTIKDRTAYGPGVLDMKSGITLSLFALEALFEDGWQEKDITVFFCGDEETAHPMTNAADLFMEFAKDKDAVFNMESGRPDGGVIIGRKGTAKPTFKIKGIGAHAGNEPEKGASAILEAAHKIIEIQNLTDMEKGTTFNVGTIKGGVVFNAVPDNATFEVDIRALTIPDMEQALKDLKAISEKTYIAGTETVVEGLVASYPPMETTDKVKELFALIQEQGRKLGIEIEGFVVGGGSDAAWTVKAGAATVCSMGSRGGLNHSVDEFILLDGFVERAKLLALCADAV
jgi:Acetylornithine deacetylase/Succinyl-diaminopimelate desuccinylase and related deacylases